VVNRFLRHKSPLSFKEMGLVSILPRHCHTLLSEPNQLPKAYQFPKLCTYASIVEYLDISFLISTLLQL
jgi:hypothetical protein